MTHKMAMKRLMRKSYCRRLAVRDTGGIGLAATHEAAEKKIKLIINNK